MTKLRELKTLMLCIFCVAVSSLISLFYYTVKFERYMKSGRAHLDLLLNDTQWSRQLQGRRNFSGSIEQRWNNELTYHLSAESVGGKRNPQEQNIDKNRSNINLPNDDLVTKNRRNYIRSLCPEKSSALGKARVFLFLIMSCLHV